MTPAHSAVDQLILKLLQTALEPYGPSAATIVSGWDDEFQIWDFEIVPTRPDAMTVTATFDGQDAILLNLDAAQIEFFPVTDQVLERVREIVEAVFAGKVQLAGDRRDSYIRVKLPGGFVEMGAAHIHVPWAWHDDAQSFAPYGTPPNS